jgi:hypothetical protein
MLMLSRPWCEYDSYQGMPSQAEGLGFLISF